ncbi:hypothetical protein [Frateuria sp. STR12]|uniref:hypothetical protein n=1 Tax=Frateuria hangzhouensis TaxID=2995589 RepID=UPI002260F630|nr:hypothetical protein [Frateuria sp. STR12]MCX7512971.1 hypothetical protein [Frateuria sp. STR12]
MNLRLTCSAIALAVAGSFFSASPAVAQPNCSSCVPAYEGCVASGATDCDTRYRVCLRFCPLASVSAPDKPIKQYSPHEGAIETEDKVAGMAR